MSHALKRLKERYGIDATLADLARAAQEIRSGNSVLMGRHKENERHLVRIRGTAVIVAWRDGWITSVLPSQKRYGKPRCR